MFVGNLNNIGLVDFALALGPYNDININTDRQTYFLNHFFGVRGPQNGKLA